jgi:hypothetical protein
MSEKYPSLIKQVTKASQRPVVGNALNWQGQPQLQLQLAASSPAIRHLIFVGSLIFLLLHLATKHSSLKSHAKTQSTTPYQTGLLLILSQRSLRSIPALTQKVTRS